ncbi:hypothetical protein MTMN5_04110 (plasmid) [Marinobacter salarius]|nr:hypothetical protein MTMN5_04110 [Marinobacter salarius]
MDKTIVHNGIARKCSLGAGVALLFLVSLYAGDGVSFQETWGWICGGILCGFAAIHPISKVYERSAQKYGEYCEVTGRSHITITERLALYSKSRCTPPMLFTTSLTMFTTATSLLDSLLA